MEGRAIGSATRSIPPIDSPEQVLLTFVGALVVGDPHLAAACFARDACFVTPDATVVRGRAEIRDILAQLISMRLEIEVAQRRVLTIGDTALSSERWTTRLGGGDRQPLVQSQSSTAVLRQLDGGWKLLIAAPWGWP